MYHRILVPIDGSATSERGLREAMELASHLKSQLVLLHVVADYPLMIEMASELPFDEFHRRLVKLGEGLLDQARRHAADAGIPCETVLREVTSRRAADVILEEAGKRACRLIVMGTHGRRGFDRLTMGSDAEMVVRESPVPVLLVRKPDRH